MKRLIFLFVLLIATVFVFTVNAGCPPGYSLTSVTFAYTSDVPSTGTVTVTGCCKLSEYSATGYAYNREQIINSISVTPASAAVGLDFDEKFYQAYLQALLSGADPCSQDVPPCTVDYNGTQVPNAGFQVTITRVQCGYYYYYPPTSGNNSLTFVCSEACPQDGYCKHIFKVCQPDSTVNIYTITETETEYIPSSCPLPLFPKMKDTEWFLECVAAPCEVFVPLET